MLVVLLIWVKVFASAQNLNSVSGIWKMAYKPWPHIPAIDLELTIYEPVQNMLYPTRMKISYAHFKGEYDLLLAKKGENKLGIARNKYPLKEEPFSLGSWPMYLNGHLALDKKNQLKLQRLPIKEFGMFMAGLYDDEMQTSTKVSLRNFLYDTDITLKQVSKIPGHHPKENDIIIPKDIYYGVYEPVEVQSPNIRLSILDEEDYDKDSVTIVHNGKVIADRFVVEKVSFLDSIKLQEGDNFIAFFAENYGDIPPNTADFRVYTEGALEPQYGFDFSNKSNAYATAIVAHFIYHPAKTGEPIKIESPTITDGRKDRLVGRLKSDFGKITAELWDAQKEDGDTVSIFLNGQLIAGKIGVKKIPQQLQMQLKKGENTILFKAENLGSIPPNTAALKIYVGSIEKTIMLNTDYSNNNIVEIDCSE